MASAFVERELQGQNTYKDSHRKDAADFLLKYQTKSPRILGLPCYTWKSEKLILKKYPDATFLAFERDAEVYPHVVENAPGNERSVSVPNLIAYTDQAVIVRGNLAEMFEKFGNLGTIQGAWIDTCSPLSVPLISFMSKLPRILDAGMARVPAALTVIKGREQRKLCKEIKKFPDMPNMGRRSVYLSQIPVEGPWKINVLESTEYTSEKNCPMELMYIEYVNTEYGLTNAQIAGKRAAETRRRTARHK